MRDLDHPVLADAENTDKLYQSQKHAVSDVVLQTIKVVARNLSGASKLLARNHIIIQQD
jgi:hypothetical protein